MLRDSSHKSHLLENLALKEYELESENQNCYFGEPIVPQQKINYLTIEVLGKKCFLSSGLVSNQPVENGTILYVDTESNLTINTKHKVNRLNDGFWSLHITVVKKYPAVVCNYFDKRTQTINKRYVKVFFKDGVYQCGPRFPKGPS